MTGMELVQAANSTASLISFITGGGLSNAIASVVGDIHAEAANLALSMSNDSNAPEDRIKSAITHLEAAHIAYNELTKHRDSFIVGSIRMVEIEQTAKKNRLICVLMALCYSYLGDFKSAKNALSMARQAATLMETYDKSSPKEWLRILMVPAMVLNPGHFKAMVTAITGNELSEISPLDLDKIEKSFNDMSNKSN